MGYVIDSAEKTQKSATEQETKTMLYLMGYMDDSKKIESFIIDVFNDVTAVNEDKTIYWDSQSKGDASSSPAAIGKELVTLFKNYISIFNFDHYILSLRKVAEKNVVESKRPLTNVCVLKFEDFTSNAQQEIINNLKEACDLKTYINVDENIDTNIRNFLGVVKIVINNDPNSYYVKKITFMKDDLINDIVINDIFETIRKEQVAIKTRAHINGIELNQREEGFTLNRTITVKSINSLILTRIIGHDIISKNSIGMFIPVLFNDYIIKHGLLTDEIDGEVNDAINGIYSMLINENLNKDFWDLIYAILEECEKANIKVYDVYNNLLANHNNILYLRNAKENELIYLIACILGGKRNED